jgi:hypothetical protein
MGRKSRRKSRRRGPIQDINHNNTNIQTQFKAVISPVYTADTGTGGGGFQSISLNAGITKLTQELGNIYKLYRFISVKFEFQADPNPSTTIASGKPTFLAINYIPAKETPITSWPNPLDLDVFEGPAVGFYATNRGHPYSYKIPSNILNAMPYNWYETRQNTPQFSDYTQGQIFLKTTDLNYYSPILAHFVVEFQTLEDPEFLSSTRPIQKLKSEASGPLLPLPETVYRPQTFRASGSYTSEQKEEEYIVPMHPSSCRMRI